MATAALAVSLLASELLGWRTSAPHSLTGALWRTLLLAWRAVAKRLGLALLLVLLLAAPARADDHRLHHDHDVPLISAILLARADDPPLAPVRGPSIVLPAATTPPPVQAVPPGALMLTTPVCPPAPERPAFTDTTAGRALAYVSAIGAALVSVSASAAGILATWPR